MNPGEQKDIYLAYEDACTIDQFKDISRRIKELESKGEYFYPVIYADICLRCLDGPHTKEEAAKYYIIASDTCDGDALPYLNSLHEDLIDPEIMIDQRISLLVEQWNMNKMDCD